MKTLKAGLPIQSWKVRKDNDNGIELVDTKDGLVHATIIGCTAEAQKLIAAAPELLEVLKSLKSVFNGQQNLGSTATQAEKDAVISKLVVFWNTHALNAIAKAEGK